jgi:hypothetical protein
VARAQVAAFREWEQFSGERLADLKRIGHPALVVNGVHDEMIPVRNSYWLAEHLPNAMLLTYPDAGMALCFSGTNRSSTTPRSFWHQTLCTHRTESMQHGTVERWTHLMQSESVSLIVGVRSAAMRRRTKKSRP